MLATLIMALAGCADTPDADRAMVGVRDELERSLLLAVGWSAYADEDLRTLLVDSERATNPADVDEAMDDGYLSFGEFRKFEETMDFVNHHRSHVLVPFLDAMADPGASPVDAHTHVVDHLEAAVIDGLYENPEVRVILARQPDIAPDSITRDDFAALPPVADFVAPITESVLASVEAVLAAHDIDTG